MSGSDSEEENVIKYGTPLEPYEEDEIPSKRKFQQPSDQYAVDAHGRRRFHGAFTGGFSAGYGNSVGTPEGWTPASFKSSRSEKAEISKQKPEDYMDDEDRGEFGIAPQRLQTGNEFTGQKRQRQGYHDGPIPGVPVLEQLIEAVHESAAVKMLRRMGWRDGQGVGSRLTRDEKRRAKQEHKVYACYIPPELRQDTRQQSEDSSDSEMDYNTLFAPDDYEPHLLRSKSDRFGLGYSGLSRRCVLGQQRGDGAASHLLMNEKGKKVSIRGQAFGVGAFEADDADIYAPEDMSRYDFALGDAQSPQSKPAQSSSKVLEGFAKASKPLPPGAKYPPPALPRGYVPAAAGALRSRFEPSAQPQRDQGLGRHELTAAARGALLGETPIATTNETAPRSATPVVIGKVIDMTKPVQQAGMDFIPLASSGSSVVPKVFKPFVNDAAKQARYERYLEGAGDAEAAGSTEEAGGSRGVGGLSEWEKNRERLEFEQSARLYRPLTGLMSDRFTHAAEPDDAVNPLTAVTKSTSSYGLATPEQVEAARKGLYGLMTRKQAPWRPEPLVCKRFNVPEPGGDRSAPAKQEKPKVSYSVFSYLETSVHDRESFTKEQSKFSGSKSITDSNQPKKSTDKRTEVAPSKTDIEPIRANKRMTVAELFLKESEKDLKSTEKVEETIEKFDKMDLYKSIFLSDSEPELEEAKDNTMNYLEKPKNTERNLSPTRGIFANIDFDELNSWKRQDKKTEPAATKDKETVKNKDTTAEDKVEQVEAVYGPKIPENLAQRITSNDGSYKPIFLEKSSKRDKSSSSDSWVDANEVKSKKQRKKKVKVKKHKSKHKKAKHRKKDK